MLNRINKQLKHIINKSWFMQEKNLVHPWIYNRRYLSSSFDPFNWFLWVYIINLTRSYYFFFALLFPILIYSIVCSLKKKYCITRTRNPLVASIRSIPIVKSNALIPLIMPAVRAIYKCTSDWQNVQFTFWRLLRSFYACILRATSVHVTTYTTCFSRKDTYVKSQ